MDKNRFDGLSLNEMDEKLSKEREELLKRIDEYNDRVLDMRMWANSCGKKMNELNAKFLDYE